MLWERHLHGDPLIEPGLLANRTYTSGLLVALAFFGAFGGLLLCVSLFAQLGEGFSPIHAGLDADGDGRRNDRRDGRGLRRSSDASAAICCTSASRSSARAAVVLALTVTGARTASTLDLAPGLFLIGVGAGISMGQLFDFILAGVGMDEVGSASGVLEAVQQLSSAVGVAVLGTIFFSAFAGHLPTHALAITAWACLVPIAAAFALIFRLPMHARDRHT